MLYAGGGGGYSGTTNWHQYNVEQMWALVAHHETDSHWKHVAAWRKTYELTSTHMSRVKEYRDNLAAAWPPEKSAAARVFIDRLDHLINHMESLYQVASDNYTVFSTATSALSLSRHKLKQVYDEYVLKKRQKQEYDEAEKSSLLPRIMLGKPPVTDGELEQLNAKARSIMYELSGTLVEARVKLQKPEPYNPPRSGISGRDDSTSTATSATPPPPMIPPVVPIGTPPPPAPPATTAPSAPLAPTPVQQAPSMGPVLGGAGPITAPPPPTTAPPVIAPGPAPTPGLVPPPTVPLAPGGHLPIGGGPSSVNAPLAPGVSAGPVRPGAGGLPGPGVPGSGAGGVGGMPRVMPPGGLIGGGPGAGLGQPVPPQAPSRVNPVGGVIGGQRAGAGGIGPGGAGAGGVGAAGYGTIGTGQSIAPHGARPGQTSRRRDEEKSTRRWDPDNPWQVDEGVEGVVGPAKAPGPVDPGPAIGLNR